jgi:phenylalanyl-tRNA synthetase beta chain
MNILASYSWIKEYCKAEVSPEVFAQELSLRSMSVEHIDVLRDRFAHIVVGEIKEIVAHPNANKLRIAKTDVGERVVDIVCGGSNLEVSQKVVVALPGAKVRWHGEGDLIELQETEIRGVKSIGMICAAAEIGFEKIAAGEKEIWDITALTQSPAGTPLAEALDLDDVVFDIEITTNRPDCMGILGLAREGAASVQASFVPHELWLADAAKKFLEGAAQGPKVSIADKKLCSRYMAARIDGVKVGPSPWWLQKKLLLSGHRPINIIVDITNLVLQEFGQPMHTFDASQVKDEIIVRKAKKGEKLVALDGKTYDLQPTNLVIADAEKPLAIAGVMGGLESGTTEKTTSIIFETATFDGVSVRKTSRALNLYSDSQLIFEKGLSPEALPAALAYAVRLTTELAGGTLAGVTDVYEKPEMMLRFPVRPQKIRARIGVDIPDEKIEELLTRLGFALEKAGKKVTALIPFWRAHDIEEEVDLTEEVARMYGYHLMPATLPVGAPPTTPDDASLSWEMRLKRVLASEGLTEFFGYSFIDARDLEKAGISPAETVRVWNPLSEELGYMRPSLMPSFLRDCALNAPHTPTGEVFEIARVYIPRENDLPEERLALVAGVYGVTDGEESYRRVRAMLGANMRGMGITYRLEREETQAGWHPGRTAKVLARLGNEEVQIGLLGQTSAARQEAFGLLRPVMFLSLDLERLLVNAKERRSYVPVPEYQGSERDISVLVAESVTHEEMIKAMEKGEFIRGINLHDIYRGEGIPAGKKSVTYTLSLGAPDRTLTSEEIENVLRGCIEALQVRCGAEVR